MASTAAVLNIMVAANTAPASAQLTALQGQLARTTAQANSASGAVGGGLAKGSKIGAVGMVALGAAALGAGKFLSGAVKVTIDFEQKMSSLRATTKASAKDMKSLERQAMSMGKATVFSATEAAQAQIELAKGGLSVSQILSGGLKSALALAAAGELDLASAASTTVNVMKLFGIEGRNAMQVADMLATAANKTTADVSDFSMALVQGGSVAKQAGIDLNQTVTILEALAEAGIKGSDAGTSMKAALLQLLNPTTKQAKLAAQLGLEFTNQNGQLKNAAELSRDLRVATEGMTQAERVKYLAILAGTDGFRTLSSLYDAGPAKLEALTKANEQYGSALDISKEKTDNLAGDLEQLSGSVEDLQLKIGKTGNPAFRGGIQAFTKLIDGLGEAILDPSIGNSRFFQQIQSIPKAAQSAYTSLRDSTAGIAADIGDLFGGAWRFVRKVTGNAISAVIERVRRIVSGVRGAVEAVRGVLAGGWRSAWNSAAGFVGRSVGKMGSSIKSVLGPVKKTFQSVVRIVKDKFNEAFRAAATFVGKIGGVLGSIPGVGAGKAILDKVTGILGLQRGGVLTGGKASGDSIPAMLERGEYVLNRRAVEKIGVERLNQINFSSAPRFQQGGPIGLQGGGFMDTLLEFPAKFIKPVINAGTNALEVLMNGPQQFIKMLPRPNLPQPITGAGPYVIEKAIEFIKQVAQSPLQDNAWVDANTFQVANFLAGKFGASISSSYRSPAQNAAAGGVPNSSHTRGTPSNPGAFDFVPPSGGMQSFAGKNIAGITENMIHDVGSGLHNHIAFFQRGGLAGRGFRALRKGKGKKPGSYPGQAKINALNPRIARLLEEIELYERFAGADWSEAGSDFSENETATLVRQYKKLKFFYESQRNLIRAAIPSLQKAIKRLAKALKDEKDDKKKRKIQKSLNANKSALSGLTSRKQELEGLTGRGGLIGDVAFRLNELGVGVSVSPGPTDSDLAELLREQLTQTQRALAVSQAQMPIFQQFMPRFHQGGIVQGPRGAERPVMAQAGEGIFTRDQMRAMGSSNITVVIEDGAIDSNRIRVEVDGVIQEKVSTVRRQGSNRRFATTR